MFFVELYELEIYGPLNYFVSIYVLGKVLIKRVLKVIAGFFFFFFLTPFLSNMKRSHLYAYVTNLEFHYARNGFL